MTEQPVHAYVGQELELFAHAQNWKRYWGSVVQPYLRGDVLEVGARLGVNTGLLRNASFGSVRRWVCLEPDARLLEQLRASVQAQSSTLQGVEPRLGTLASIHPGELFDAILYIDVLEHILDDAGEIRRAAAHLRHHGRLIVLSPAHQWLFSEFDASIGHHRRYSRKSLRAAAESAHGLREERILYLDSCGLLASAANRLLLRQSLPSRGRLCFGTAPSFGCRASSTLYCSTNLENQSLACGLVLNDVLEAGFHSISLPMTCQCSPSNLLGEVLQSIPHMSWGRWR